jgi:hypothetical protein
MISRRPDIDDLPPPVPGGGPELLEGLAGLDAVPLGQDADGLLHPDPGQQGMLQLAHGGAQLAGLAGQGLARRLGHRRRLAIRTALLGGQEVGQDHGRGQVGHLVAADPPAVLGPPYHGLGVVLAGRQLAAGGRLRARMTVAGRHLTTASSCSRCLTWAADGLVMALPSGNTTVGTVWLPPLTDMT